jgi:hypothetical protein
VVVDVFCDTFGMLYNVLDPILFSYALKHELYAMCNIGGPKYGLVIGL